MLALGALARIQVFVLPMKKSPRLLLQFALSLGQSRASCGSGGYPASSRPLPYYGAPRTAFKAKKRTAGASRMVAAGHPDAAAETAAVGDDAAAAAAPETADVGDAAETTAETTAVVETSAVRDAAAETAAVGAATAGYAAAVGDAGADVAAETAADVAGGDGQRQAGEWFRVSDSVSLVLHRGDITEWFVDGETDAIVNAANTYMLGGGGVDGAIHKHAGPKLLEACRRVPQVSPYVRCPVGEARITPGFDLPVSRVIHTVGPMYSEDDDPAGMLGNAYRNSLRAAIGQGIKYIAFPAISCGIYGYPPAEAASVSLSAIREASNGLSQVHFVFFANKTYSRWMDEASSQFEHI